MKRTIAVLLAGLAIAVAARSQDAHPHDDEPQVPAHDGTWNVVMEDGKGGRWTGRFVLGDFNGTWTVAPTKGRRDPKCDGKPAPITVQATTEEHLDMSVWGTSLAPSCADLTPMMLTKQPDGRLKGTLADGRTVVLTRVPDKKQTAKSH
jgi:hypothetical protein